MARPALYVVGLLAAGVVVAMIVSRTHDQESVAFDVTRLTPAPRSERVGEHFLLEDPATLTESDAVRVYESVRAVLRDNYALSGLPAAAAYQDWPRFNRAPYRSATHGERFVNNYTNRLARDYGSGQPMPVGAVLAKDAVTVKHDGQFYPGPLALMEKMPPGFDPDGHDWRYTLVMPDGTVLGTTRGANDEQVAFCRNCHATAGADHDFLFFVPEAFRRPELAVPASGQRPEPASSVNREGG
ncbi:MAG: cytochrome P460 family protein [Geminicoccaceae bacterium]